MNLIGKQCCYMGEKVCKVTRTVIPSPYVLIWDGSATSSLGGGVGAMGRVIRVKLLKDCVPRILPTGTFQNGN